METNKCVIITIELLKKIWEVVGTYELMLSTRDLQKLIEMIWKICICHYEKIEKWLSLSRNSLHRKILINNLPKGWVNAFLKPYSHVNYFAPFSLCFKLGCMHSYGGVHMMLQNVRKIKGAADKSGINDVTFEQLLSANGNGKITLAIMK